MTEVVEWGLEVLGRFPLPVWSLASQKSRDLMRQKHPET